MSPLDLFGGRAELYARSRPTYPEALFDHLAERVPERGVAWDAGTGSGQSATALARRFARVVGTDASRRQLAHAPRDSARFVVAAVEQAPLRDASVDLVTVSAALHWFDRPRFYAEVRRVCRPGALVAAWSYYHAIVTPEVDAVLERYAATIVGPLWRPEMQVNIDGYRTLEFPFERLPWPPFEAEARVPLEGLVAFMRTWSASQEWERVNGGDPVGLVRADLECAWGDPALERRVRWPLHGLLGRVRR